MGCTGLNSNFNLTQRERKHSFSLFSLTPRHLICYSSHLLHIHTQSHSSPFISRSSVISIPPSRRRVSPLQSSLWGKVN